MTCAEIEDLILNESQWDAVEAHARGCGRCQEYLEAARSLDRALMRTPPAPARLPAAVLAAISPKPSYLPELLDFIGAAAMVTVAVGLVQQLLATY